MKAADLAKKNAARAAAAAIAAGQPVVEAAPDTAVPVRDLDDITLQEKILEPPVVKCTVGDDEIVLHPLPARKTRQLVSLVGDILAVSAKTMRPGIAPEFRLGTVITTDEFSMAFCRFVARATFPTDSEVADESIEEVAKQIDESAGFKEFAMLLDAIMSQNRVTEVFGRPK